MRKSGSKTTLGADQAEVAEPSPGQVPLGDGEAS